VLNGCKRRVIVMPIFEFKCDRCGDEFERVVFASDSEPVKCPKCSSEETRKLLSVFACTGLEKALDAGCSSKSGFS
jgi:putative FmdB family regulatory protein